MSNLLELTDETFDQATSQAGLKVVDFWAPWCGPRRAMARQIEGAATLRPQYCFAKVNVDENPALASAYGVRAIPTLAILRDGELLGTAPGLIRSGELVAALDRVAAAAADAPSIDAAIEKRQPAGSSRSAGT